MPLAWRGEESHLSHRIHERVLLAIRFGASRKGEDYWGNVNPIGPRGVYDEAKRFCGSDDDGLPSTTTQMDTKIVRIFNRLRPAHAAQGREGSARKRFIGQALTGEALTIFGDGSQTRSFCYVSDLIDGIFRLAMSDFHDPVNIGNPREMTIKQFAEEIIRITGTASRIEHRPLPVDDPKVRQPDITRARNRCWQMGAPRGLRRRHPEDD